MIPVSDLVIGIISRKRLVRSTHQITGFATLGLDPSIIAALCDYCEFREMCGNLLTLIIDNLSVVSTPESVLDVVRRHLRHLMKPFCLQLSCFRMSRNRRLKVSASRLAKLQKFHVTSLAVNRATLFVFFPWPGSSVTLLAPFFSC